MRAGDGRAVGALQNDGGLGSRQAEQLALRYPEHCAKAPPVWLAKVWMLVRGRDLAASMSRYSWTVSRALECRGREESPALQRHEPSSARTRREDGIVRAERLGGVQDEERVFFRTEKEGWELFRIGRLPPFSQNSPTSCQSKRVDAGSNRSGA